MSVEKSPKDDQAKDASKIMGAPEASDTPQTAAAPPAEHAPTTGSSTAATTSSAPNATKSGTADAGAGAAVEAPTAQVRVQNQGADLNLGAVKGASGGTIPAKPQTPPQDSPAQDSPELGASASVDTQPVDLKPNATAREPEPQDSQTTAVKEPPTTTALLSMRPPEEEVRRRSQLRDTVPTRNYTGYRVLQVLLAIFVPFLLIFGAIRVIATPLFLWIEYYRPGFPTDSTFSSGERLDYGSYAVDYLFNFASPAYLGDLMNKNDQNLFLPSEVSHMADVKAVILISLASAVVVLIAAVIFMIILNRKYKGGIRRALFAGSVATTLIMVGLGVIAALGWQQFFTAFHEIFFAQGNWQFRSTDTLIRLFPTQFWIDAAASVAGLALIASIVIMVLTWPTGKRRAQSLELQEFIESRD